MAPGKATFRKQERLTGRDAMSALMKHGSALNDRPFRLVGCLRAADEPIAARVAFAIPKRHIKSAVERNLVRRRMREAYRLEKERWYRSLHAAGVRCEWLFIYQSSQILAYSDVRQRLCGLADRWLSEHLPKAPSTQG